MGASHGPNTFIFEVQLDEIVRIARIETRIGLKFLLHNFKFNLFNQQLDRFQNLPTHVTFVKYGRYCWIIFGTSLPR